MSERSTYLRPPATGEQRLVVLFLTVSVGAHLAVFSIDKLGLFKGAVPYPVEWEIETEILTDFDLLGAEETTLPEAQPAEEVTVPDNMLPQITRTFSVPEEQVPESVAPDESVDQPPTPAAEELVREANDTPIRRDDDSNRLTKQEALKRLALEQLRQDSKDKERQATREDALARIRDQLALNQLKATTQMGASGESALNRYRSRLQQAVRRHYALPEAYSLKDANLVVVIAITVNERGELMSANIAQPSGDAVFDELAFTAVRRATPLPPPPRGHAGELIHLQFTPRNI